MKSVKTCYEEKKLANSGIPYSFSTKLAPFTTETPLVLRISKDSSLDKTVLWPFSSSVCVLIKIFGDASIPEMTSSIENSGSEPSFVYHIPLYFCADLYLIINSNAKSLTAALF